MPRLTPTWDKRLLSVEVSDLTAATEPVPVLAILFVEEAEMEAHAPRFVALGTAETVVRLAAHSSASHLLSDSARAAGIDRVQHWAVEAVRSSDN